MEETMTLDEIIEQKGGEYGNQFLDKDVKDSEFMAHAADLGYTKGFKEADAIGFVWWLIDNYKIWNVDDGTWMNLTSKSAYKTEELYIMYLNSKK